MPYIANTPEDQREMLKTIGIKTMEELFKSVPESVRLKRLLNVPASMTELELTRHMHELSHRNMSASTSSCFLGGGSYDHFVPAVVDMVALRNEFYTAYTPYQAEASQGSLQVFFEFQTLLCQLTGMDAANASLYDGISAAAEAAFMAISVTQRHGKIIVPHSLHPHAQSTLQTYLKNLETELVTIETPDGFTDPDRLREALDDTTACVIVQHPNFFGTLEDMQSLSEVTHEAGALFVSSVDPISLPVLQGPTTYDADIVIAEGQPLGIPLQFGGPYLGIIACKSDYVRRLPGRVVGETTDRNGNRCFVLTLQTREQHIRREKATSNICTNQGLLALRATAYLAAMGPQGMREVAEQSCQKAHYTARSLSELDGVEMRFPGRFFREFAVRVKEPVQQVLARLRSQGILGGLPLGKWYPELSDCILIALTEKRTRSEIDQLVAGFAASGTESGRSIPQPHSATLHPTSDR